MHTHLRAVRTRLLDGWAHRGSCVVNYCTIPHHCYKHIINNLNNTPWQVVVYVYTNTYFEVYVVVYSNGVVICYKQHLELMLHLLLLLSFFSVLGVATSPWSKQYPQQKHKQSQASKNRCCFDKWAHPYCDRQRWCTMANKKKHPVPPAHETA